MDKILTFISNNATQVWTLISVILGGMVTYVSTSMSEKRKNKNLMQREKMEQVLIPYCICIEQAIENIRNFYDEQSIAAYQQWINDSDKLIEYLSPSKRVFLSKTSRNLLQNYNNQVDIFKDTLENECKSCLWEYKDHITNILQDFSNIRSSIYIVLSMKDTSENKTKLAILTKKDISLIHDIIGVHFIHNDDEDNHQETTILLTDAYRETWGPINYGFMSMDDITDPDEELACVLLEFIAENVSDEKRVLENIIDNTISAELFNELMDKLQEMQKTLIKEIDKIAM